MAPVLETQGLPPYPPARNVWEFPPPPVQKRWKWIAVAAMVLGLVVAVVLVSVLVELDRKDAPGLIEDGTLVSIIDRECELMRSTVESMPLSGSPTRQARTIGDQNEAVEGMLERIRARGGAAIAADRPTEEWLADWQTILDARSRFAAGFVTGGADDFELPLDADGDPVHLRMNDVWLGATVCEVPAALLSPYPDQAPSDI